MKLFRFLPLLLAALLCLGMLAGCSRRDTAEESSQSESSQPEIEEPKGYVRGVWEDGVFENEYIGLGFSLPEGWVAATEEEMLNSMSLGADLLSDQQRVKAAVARLTSVYDTTITNLAEQCSLSIMAENLTMSLGGTSLDEQSYAELMARQLEETSLPYTIGETAERTVAGEIYCLLPASVDNMPTAQWMLFRRVEDYMVTIVASFPDTAQESIEALLDSMTAV